MKATDLIIHNFLSIGEAKLRLDGLGLVHVSGINNDETSADSNGSGKSSLADAFSWCIWGSTARGVGADDVINQIEGKNCSVSLTLDDEGELYRIDRYRKHSKHKNFVRLYKHDGKDWEDLTRGTNALTQKAIERLMGCSEEVFNAAVYSGQEAMPDIPRMTDKQLKTLVEQAAGVDVLTSAYEIAREKLRAASSERATAQIELDHAQSKLDDAQTTLARSKQQKEQWATTQAQTIASLKSRTQTSLAEYKQAQADIDEAGNAQLLKDIEDCENKIASVSQEQVRERLLASEVDEARRAVTLAEGGLSLARQNADNAAVQVTHAEGEVEAAKKSDGGTCNSCGQAMGPEHAAKAVAAAEQRLAAAKERATEAAAKVAAARKRVPTAEKILQDANATLEAHRQSMTDVSAETERLRHLNRERDVAERLRAEVERLRVQTANLADQIKREVQAVNPFEQLIAAQEAEITQRGEALSDAEVELAAKTEAESYAQAVAEVFSPSGVRAHRLDEATPYLNDRTAHYLGSLADGAIDAFWTTLVDRKSGKGGLVERFSVTVEKAGTAPSFNNLSGGEKRKVRLACALALQDLVAERATKNIELWVGDEIDDALDDAGLERLMGILEEKARDRGTVLVISHNDIGAYARKSIQVEKTGGKASVAVI